MTPPVCSVPMCRAPRPPRRADGRRTVGVVPSLSLAVAVTLLTIARPGIVCAIPPGAILTGSLVNLGTFDSATTGRNPLGPLVMDPSGNLFGATNSGGSQRGGTLFEIAAGTSGITILAPFLFPGATGYDVAGGLAIDGNGNLYGAATSGGSSNDGTVFELANGSGVITPLAQMPQFGNQPQTLIVDADGNLFGEATSGGNLPGQNAGYVFEVAKGTNTVTILASLDFDTQGSGSGGSLLMDAGGNLFGTTSGNTVGGFPGIVFELPHGSSTIMTVAHFAGDGGGFSGNGNLVMDAAGNLFGTTSFGGTSNDGTVFEVARGSAMVTTLASFDGSNGQQPVAGLVRDGGGNLFGTTLKGGASGVGTIFELPAGSNTITALVSFDTANGARPTAPLIMDANGNLFGTASTGGNANGDGTVFAFGNLSVTPGGTGGPGGGGTCGTIPACLTALQAAEPSSARTSNHKERKVAIRLDNLVARAGTLIGKATTQTGKKQHRSYKRARALIQHAIGVAKAANAKGTLGVSLAPIETAGNALLGLLPA